MPLSDSSDFRQAVDLLRALAGPPAQAHRTRPLPARVAARPAVVMAFTPPSPPRAEVEARVPAASPAPEKVAVAADGRGEIRFLGDEISDILRSMCRRGGFAGALVADAMGLPLGDFNCPVEPEAAAACSSVLGDALERAGRLLGQSKADSISMDVNYVDKVALHRFELAGSPCYLMVVCPQHIDERSEVEVSIERLIEVLGRGECPAAIKKVKKNDEDGKTE